MTHTTHGAQPTKGTPQKESAGGCKDEFAATTADTNNTSETIAPCDRLALGMARYSSILEPLALVALIVGMVIVAGLKGCA